MRAVGKTATLILFLVFVHPFGVFVQTDNSSAANLGADEQRFIRKVTANELAAQKQDHTLWQYIESKREETKTTLSEIVETQEGSLHGLLAVNGKSLSPAEGAERSGSHQ